MKNILALPSVTSEAYTTPYHYTAKYSSAEALYLSVMIGPASFVYALSTNEFKQIVELVHVEIPHFAGTDFHLADKISFLIQNYQLTQRKFKKVNISVLNSEFTLLPMAFAAENEAKSLLQFATGAENTKLVLQHQLKDFNFYFALDQDLVNTLEKAFPNASIRHQGAVHIHLLFSQHSLAHTTLFLNIGNRVIELSAKENTSLLFYNVFNFETNDDILYYLLFMMEQFQLDPLRVKLSLAAERDVEDELVKSIKKYIKQVNFCVGDPSVLMQADLALLPKHYYFTLLNQHVCAL